MRAFPPLFKHLSTVVATLVGATIVFWSLPAVAAGFFLPTRGVESTARGGASIAPHEAELDSMWHNPAGLSLIDDYQLSVDLAAVDIRVEHQRAPREMDDGSMRSYQSVKNQAPPNPIPSIMVGGPSPHEAISWAVGVYTHYAGSGRYPMEGPQRYVLVDNIGTALGYVHAAMGIELNDELSLGFGLQNFMGDFRIVSVGSGYIGMFGDPEDKDLDMPSEANVSSYFNPTANIGLTYRPIENLQTGLSVQLPHVFTDREATIDARVPEHPAYDGAELSDNRVEISVPFPFYVRGGARYIGNKFDLEAALVYQHWSILDEVVITPLEAEVRGAAVLGSVPVQPMTIPQGFRNTISAHLGGGLEMSDEVELRGGYVYERSAVPDERYSLFALDPDKHQLSAGVGYQTGDWTFDFTGAGIIMPSREIENSEVRQNNPSDPDDDHTIVVGDGTYNHFGYIFGVGTKYAF